MLAFGAHAYQAQKHTSSHTCINPPAFFFPLAVQTPSGRGAIAAALRFNAALTSGRTDCGRRRALRLLLIVGPTTYAVLLHPMLLQEHAVAGSDECGGPFGRWGGEGGEGGGLKHQGTCVCVCVWLCVCVRVCVCACVRAHTCVSAHKTTYLSLSTHLGLSLGVGVHTRACFTRGPLGGV